MKLQDQFNEFGFSAVGMPPIEVTLGMGGEMMIIGVTQLKPN